jgi:hypothetical protein
MATQASRQTRSRRLARLGAQLVGPLVFVALALVGALVVSPATEAAVMCGDRAKIMQNLASKHDETPQAMGLSADGGVIEVLVSPEGGWTILVTHPRKPTCVVAVGEAWQSLHRLVGERS